MLRLQQQQKKKRMVNHRPSNKRMMAAVAAVSLAHSGGNNNNNSSRLYNHQVVAATTTALEEETNNEMKNNQRSLLEQKLITSYASDTSTAGAMFDMKAKGPIIIRGIDINTASNDQVTIKIWTKEGGYTGFENREDKWTLISNNKLTAAAGRDKPTSITFSSPIELVAGEKRAFYISCVDDIKCLRYNSDGMTTKRYQDDFVLLFGDGITKRLSGWNHVVPSSTPRLFSGALSYEAITQPPTDAPTVPPPTKSPTLRPSASPTQTPSSAPVELKTITSKFDSSYSYAGNMFNIQARDHVVITSMAFNTHTTDYVQVQLYTREGSYATHDKSLVGWTKIADVAVKGQGLDKPTYLPAGSFDPLHIPSKDIQAFYIRSNGPNIRASQGVAETADANDEPERSTWNSDIVIYEGIGKRIDITSGAFTPRSFNGIFEYYVTTAAPSASPTPMATSKDFRLRVYWQRDYYWQDSSRETWWCMQCGGRCHDGDSVYIDWCGSTDRQQWNTVGDTIRPMLDPTLCLTTNGYNSESRPLRVQKCKEATLRGGDVANDQTWEGFDMNNKFELHPKGVEDKCVTQQHHPKSYERVFPQDCRTTRNHE